MRNSTTTDVIACLSTLSALAVLTVSLWKGSPSIDEELHQVLGEALARETAGLVGTGGKVTVITRDTEAFPQPALDRLFGSFQQELQRKSISISETQLIQTDPLRPVEVPSGDFFERLRRSSAGDVIVSFLGPPLLTQEQRSRLGVLKPKVVALCSGNWGDTVGLREFFDAGVLHAAVVSRALTELAKQPSAARPSFETLYRTVRMTDFAPSPPITALAPRPATP